MESEELVKNIADLFDQIELTPEELDQELRDMGYDPETFGEEMAEKVEEMLKESKPVGFTPGPWSACRDGECKCKQVWGEHHPVATVISGEWGDEYEDIRLEPREDRIGHKAVAYTEKIVYGTVDENVAIANARLIASAPNMKEALEEIKDRIRIMNDEDAYLYALVKWALRESNVKPKTEDFGLADG